MSGFEGSFLGDSEKLRAESVMECGVCWWIYDPEIGDEVWQIAPGTAFTDLPSHWRCPNCDAAPGQFMVLRQGAAHRHPPRAAGIERISSRTAAVDAAYRRVLDTMRSLPVYNDKLDVLVTGMRRCEYGLIAVAATPWCMNLLLLPHAGETGREGSTRELSFPSGRYSFIAGHLEGVGVIETCSLFSPMHEFEDPEVVASVADHAIDALFLPEPEAIREQQPLSRRQFLRPGSSQSAGQGA